MKEYRETGIQDRFQDRVHEEPPQSDASGALRRAKEFAEMIVDSVREGLLVLDLDLRVEAANQSFYDHFHVKPYETVGRLVYDLGGGQWDIPELRRLLEEILPERKVMDDYEVTYDFEGLGEREMLLNARQVDDHELILLAIEDVTERRETARALRRSEKRYRTALRNSPVVFARVDDALRYEWIFNPHPDFDPSVTIGKRDDELASGPGIDALVALKRRVFETGKQERQEITFVRSDGPRTYDITATPVRDSSVRRENGQVQRLVTASLDVTERKLAEEELQALNETLEKRVEERTKELEARTEELQKRTDQLQERTEQVRALAARLTRAEREERHRISLVLHDDLQQRLYAMEMRMSMLKAQQDAGNAEAARGHAEEVLGFVDEAINVTRRLSTHLSPPVLEKEGLREALGWLASEMERMYEFTVEIEAVGAEAKGDEAKGDERVTGEDLRILLFQVVRELLFNVVKHAGVDAARVHIRHSADQIGIRVSDDGAGFDPEGLDPNRAAAQDTRAQAEATLEHTEAQATAAFGLADAHKRLQLVGGAMEVESAPGEGTRVTVQAPTSGTAAPEHGSS